MEQESAQIESKPNQTSGNRPHILMRKLLIYPKIQIFLLIYPMLVWMFVIIFLRLAQYAVQNKQITAVTPIIFSGLLILFASGALFIVMYSSNRVFGPIFHLQQHMKAIGRGAPPRPLTVRKDDKLAEVISDYNIVIARLQKSEEDAQRSK